MFRTVILGVASVATIAAMTITAAVSGTTAATYAIGRATLTATVTTTTPETPTRYVGRFVSLL
jgi:hypothetical protein